MLIAGSLHTDPSLSSDRHQSVAYARHVAMYFCRQRLMLSLHAVGQGFGNRDHTTVRAAVQKVDRLRTKSSIVRLHVEEIAAALNARVAEPGQER